MKTQFGLHPLGVQGARRSIGRSVFYCSTGFLLQMALRYDREIKVLVVEDDTVESEVIKKQLADAPVDITALHVATSLEQAITALSREPFDAVLLDLDLSDGKGLSKMTQLHSHFSDVAIVALAGRGGDEQGFEAVGRGAQDCLVKGQFGIESLVKSLCYACERQRSLEAQRRTEGCPETGASEMEKTNRALQAMIDKSNELAQEATEANRAKSLFLANMSHELRTPMNAIIGFADLLEESDLSESQATYLRFIQTASAGLMSLLNNVLDLARLEAETFKTHPTHCIVRDLVRVVEGALRPQAEDRGITLQVQFQGETPEAIETDTAGLKRCLLNLIGNAIKFTHEGVVRMTVFSEVHQDQPHICFEVVDTGIGISEEMQEAIFEPFVQADGESTREYEGIGLGLAVAQRLARFLGGSLTLSSRLGEGSVFLLRIPAVTPATSSSEAELDDPGSRTGADTDQRSTRQQARECKGVKQHSAQGDEPPATTDGKGGFSSVPVEAAPVDLRSCALASYSDRTLRELVAAFLSEAESHMACLRNAAHREDGAAVESWALQLRGLAQSIAAQSLIDALGRLGRAIRAQDKTAVSTHLENVEKELFKVITWFSDADWIQRFRKAREGNGHPARAASE